MSPPCAILVHRLGAAGKELLPIFICEAESVSSLLMSEPRGNAVRVLDEVPQQRLDELIVGGDGHTRRIAGQRF